MKRSLKRLLSLMMVLAMALSVLPGFVLAEGEETLLAEGTVTFETYEDAFDGQSVVFTPETNGEITVEILACTPGYCVEVYEDADWIELYTGDAATAEAFAVTAGSEYTVLLYSYDAEADDAAAGSVSYKVTFVSNGEVPGEDEPEDPSLIPGGTPENPKPLEGEWDYIGAGKTVWYLFDNYQNMVDNGVYSMMLHISCSTAYSVTYAGEELTVDESGFVNFEMKDTEQTGKYLFSITNNYTEEKFFSISVKERPIYFNTGLSLNLGSNRNLQLDTTYAYTLYEFSPEKTGIYQIRVTQGQVGNWGTPFNPVDLSPNKTGVLEWTCTSIGQSVMVGFKGPKMVNCTIIRTGDYVPPVEIPWTFYENTYDFSYQLDASAEKVDVDLTDGGEHTAVLGTDGFYHYGNAEGPLMVTDLSSVEINFTEAQLNGGLRAWLMDENGETISKVDYNDAMLQYLKAGLVPVTEELAVMLQEVGTSNGWWVDGSLIFPETAPADVSMAWMQLCGYLPEPQGVTLSGSIITGTVGDATVELLSGEEVVATATVSGKTGTYSIDSVAAGIYILKVSKQNHVTREYDVTVDAEAVTQDVKIHLIGDIDGNGLVNMGDISILYANIKGTKKLTDAYQLLVANINGGSLNLGDFSALYAHINGTKKLY